MKTVIFTATRKDFRVDTFRSGGPGGQNQNKVESGVRITHLPTGMVGESREERSQYGNKQRAFERLAHKLVAMATQKEKVRQPLQGEIIRNYHEPDDRVTDRLSRQQWSFREIVGKGDLSAPIAARREAMERTLLREATS